jgi:hypothetical protein
VATEAAWLNGKKGKNQRKSKKTLDRDRPSHGRSLEKPENLENLVPRLVIFRWDMRGGLGSPNFRNGPNY